MKNVVIVGASSGIGRSLACAIGRERGRVALVSRRADALERVAYEVTAFGGSTITVVSDTRDPESVATAVKRIALEFGRIDLAILSQGIARPMGNLETLHTQPLREMVETNLMGPAYWLEALHPVLKAQDGDSTVAVLSSLAAYRSFPGPAAAYATTKAAISQYCDGLRAPWREQGIHLVTVEPGFIRTPMTDGQPNMPLLMEPEDAARVILNGLHRGASIIRFPRLATLTMATLALLPSNWFDRLYRPPTIMTVGDRRR